jgi:hypothetical protein
VHALDNVKCARATNCINTLLNDEGMKTDFEEKAYRYTRNMIWPKIAMEHINLFYKAFGI